MRLAEFIRANHESIITEWIRFAKTVTPASDDMTLLALRDHSKEILTFIADDLESPQTASEQVIKSHGDGPKEGGARDSAAETHAVLRLVDGFDIEQMVSEYRALRASIIKLWGAQNETINTSDIKDLIRFNEAMDQAIAESISRYTRKIDHSRHMFLGILGHDLRNPIGAASMAAQLMVAKGTLDPKMIILAAQVIESTARASLIITDLLDLARVGFGSKLSVVKEPMDMSVVAQQLVDEMGVFNNKREIVLAHTGETQGEWDRSRIGQVFSNLIGNALQYSLKDTPISVVIKGEADEIIVSVHNEGPPIPADKVTKIFDAMTRGTEEGEEKIGSTNLGLGLYITKKIVVSHGGEIAVTSSEKGGTVFTVKFPRNY